MTLIKSTEFSRLLIVSLNPGHSAASLKAIQDEISPVVLQLRPQSVPANYQIPFLTDGDSFGEKLLVLETTELLVEDFRASTEDAEVLRRVSFKDNLAHVQSQAPLMVIDEADPSNKQRFASILSSCKPLGKSLFSLSPSQKVFVNWSKLDFEVHRHLTCGLGLLPSAPSSPEKLLLLGAGCNILSQFLLFHFKDLSITAVDSSPEIMKIGEDYFGISQGPRLSCVVDDAKSFILAQSALPEKLSSFSAVVVDINNIENCEWNPPKPFWEPAFFDGVRKLLVPDGLLIVNLLVYTPKLVEDYIKELSAFFDIIYKSECDDELNRVVYAVNKRFERRKGQKEGEELIVGSKTAFKEPIEIKTAVLNRMLSSEETKEQGSILDSSMNVAEISEMIKLAYPELKKTYATNNFYFIDEKTGELVNASKSLYEQANAVNEKKKKKKKNKKKK